MTGAAGGRVPRPGAGHRRGVRDLSPAVVVLAVLIVVGVALRLYRFGEPILDAHAFRQTQTASEVWLWDRLGFDLFNYHVPMFGAGQWILEFPAYQFIVWLISQGGPGIEAAGRIVSIASYAGASVLLYVLASRGVGSRVAALAAVAFFTLLPVTVFYFRAVMIDPFLITMVMLATLLMARAQERWSLWCWAAFTAVFVLALLGKPTLVLALGGPMLVIGVRMILDRGRPWLERLAPVASAILGVVLLALWSHHSMVRNKASGSDWATGNPDWYFGSTFTDTSLWSSIFDRFETNLQTLGLVLVVLGLLAVPAVRTGRRPELVALVVGGVASAGIFANLNTIHDYYQLPYYVSLALFGGMGVWALYALAARVGRQGARAGIAGAVAIVAVLGVLWTGNLFDGYFAEGAVAGSFRGQAIELANATPEEGRLLVLQEDADPNEPILWYEARRVGWRLPTTDRADATRIARRTPDLSGIAFIRGASPEPLYISELAFARGFARTFESPAWVVYTRPR